MKCNCGFTGKKDDFGTLEATHPSSITGREPKIGRGWSRGREIVYFCPECGALKIEVNSKK